ncbi:MAG: hypothetical protein ACYS47_14920, partial [Planctomycetota bacterium]
MVKEKRGSLSRCTGFSALLSVLLILGIAPLGFAGDGGEEDAPVVRPDENTIYIPYKDLEKVFEKSGRGVFLPYEKFLELWRKSRPPVLEGKEEPPLPAAITAASYEGEVKEKTAEFKASFEVEVFKKGWTEVPFPFGNLAISEVKPKERGTVLAPGRKGSYALIVKAPGTYHLDVSFKVKVDDAKGVKTFKFNTPAASLARFTVTLPGRNLKVDLKPNLAASETPEGTDATKVFAFLGPSRQVELTWRPEAEQLGERKPLLHPNVLTHVRVEETVMEVSSTITYKILQAPADRFRISVPRDFLLISYDRKNLQKIDVKEEGDAKVLDLRLHSPAKETFTFNLRLQKTFKRNEDPTKAWPVVIPFVKTVGEEVQREEGTTAIDLRPPLKGKVQKIEGLSQVDVRDLPRTLRKSGTDFGFTYLKQPVSLTLEAEKERPEVSTEVRALALVEQDRIDWRGTMTVIVERTGIFGLAWLMPKGPNEEEKYKVQNLTLEGRGKLDYRVQAAGEGLQKIEVNFPTKIQGRIRIFFEIRRKRPGDVVGAFDLPWFRVPTAKKDRGWVGVRAKEGYDLKLQGKAQGFEARSAAEIQGQIREAAQLGFVYNLGALKAKAKPEFRARLEVTKRPSRVSAEVLTLVEVTDAAVDVHHTILYTVQQAGVRTFAYSLPEEIKPPKKEGEKDEKAGGRRWDVLNPEVDAKKQHTVAHDKKRKRHVWTVEIQKERMGVIPVTVQYKMTLQDLQPGAPIRVEIPDLQPEGVFQTTGYIGLKKGDNIVLTPAPGKVGKLFKADLGELPDSLK